MRSLEKNITVTCKGPKIIISPPIIRILKEKNDDDKIEEVAHLQFEIKNNLSYPIKFNDGVISYYNSNNKYIGSDESFSYHEIDKDESFPIDILLNIPEPTKNAVLKVVTEKYGIFQKNNFIFSVIAFAVIFIVMIGFQILF